MAFRWLFDEGQKPEACIDSMGFEAWLEFIFNHPDAGKDEERWYSLDGAKAWHYKDSRLFLERLSCLMEEPEHFLGPYTAGQVCQGFWCFISAFELPDVLEDASVDFGARDRCIRAFEPLYRRLFQREGYEKTAFFYWDPLTYSLSSRKGLCENQDQQKLKDSMFESLAQILTHPGRISFLSAARGLAHLHHGLGPQAIRDMVQLHENLWEGDREYALACARNEICFYETPKLRQAAGV